MNIEEIIIKLEFKYPQLKRSFGSIQKFIENLILVYPYTYISHLITLINFKGKLVVLDPLQIKFKLYENYDLTYIDAIIFEEPYQVYSIEKDLIYSVSSHYGLFGNSILDSLLTVDYNPASLFYLTYNTFTVKEQILLVNGFIPIKVDKKINLTSYNPSTLVKSEILNQVALKLVNGQRDMAKPGLPFYPVKVYQLPTSSPILLNRDSIISSSLSSKDIYDLELSNLLLINPTDSCWLVFNQITKTGEIPLKLNVVSGAGVDRLIEAKPNTYYLALDSDININLFQQAFNLENVSLPDFDNYTGLNIKAELNTL